MSRARKRKTKRENLHAPSSQVERPSAGRKPERQRAASRRGPSMREGLVEDQIRAKVDAISPLVGRLSSRLGLGNQAPAAGGRRSRRDSTARGKEHLFEATARTETQRVAGPEQSYTPIKNRRAYEARTDGEPPVLVRGGMGGMAFGRVAHSRLQKTRTPRRRIDLPLRATGAEMRLPAIPFIHLGWRGVSLFMVLLMCASLVLMWKAPIFQVKSVDATGLKRLTVNDLNAVMGTFGRSVFTLDPLAVREALGEAFPEFSKISVSVNLPARVKVAVTERQPVISWTQNGVEAWVDGEGISFPPRGALKNPLVQVEGYGTPPGSESTMPTDEKNGTASVIPITPSAVKPALRLAPEMVSAILALGAKMPAETVLVYDSQHGLGWNDPNGGWDVFFGNEDEDMEMKLSVYQSLVERLNSEGVQPALISVEYVHAPYYRMQR